MSTTSKVASLVSAGLMGAGLLVAAPPALASPPGTMPDLRVGQNELPPGGSTAVRLTNVSAECKVVFRLVNPKRIQKLSRIVPVNPETLMAATRVQVGQRAGTWSLRVVSKGESCPDEDRVRYSTFIEVG